MVDRSTILECIYKAVSETNEMLPADSRLEPNESENVTGEQAKIDSLGFVTLLVAIERELESKTGRCPNLAEEITESDVKLATIGDIASFISERV